MLGDLTRDDWLSILELPERRIPKALILQTAYPLCVR